ncbi:fungal hydrophobin [Macrolepiota fuliginosa MF-IS2]|uniref:Hydrophobin n=1 Tax=Macrolepiota fuliginosa MF-IS2 TaxID=1400762 RepID=A0A9P5XJK8_9AGAR|nr:fungal hydrophobin [Macrolepiota fuliginosa MF-IS2]
MFAKLSVVAILTAIAVAQTTTVNKCNVGSLQCCQSVQKGSSEAAQKQLAAVGALLGNGDILVGLQCNPISAAIGAGTGSNCNANPVCCKNNSFNGVVAIGCVAANGNA